MDRILVIDDDIKVRKLLRNMLEREGYHVTEAHNGTAGLKKYRNKPSDVVITDIIMPGKEGIETIQELKKEFSGVKIIAISGWNRVFLVTAERCCGVRHTFMKPVDRDELLKAVKELLH